MTQTTKKALRAVIMAALLLNASGCAHMDSVPNMEAYSYVPPPNVVSPQPAPGIQDF